MGIFKPHAGYAECYVSSGLTRMMQTKPLLKMSDLELADKRVLIREDLNVPLDKGVITHDERITRALPTLKAALAANARVIVLSHLGRPKAGNFDAKFSLEPVASALSEKLGQDVLLVKEWLDGIDVAPGQLVLCENVRFNAGEKENDIALSQRMAALCDIFVMDAFATAHRTQASTVGIATYAPIACAGPLLCSELDALSHALDNPKRPLTAIVGGSKVSTKIHLLDALLEKVDQLIVGGGIANTFLKAKGYPIGQSLYEPDWVSRASALLERAKEKGVAIPLPEDVVVAKALSAESPATTKSLEAVDETDCIVDVGPKTVKNYPDWMANAGTIVWNGPVGVFEIEAFSQGTRALGAAIAASQAYSLAGGGDTLAALDKFGIMGQISYISTGGGAFLAFLEGTPLPAITALEKRVNTK